MTFGDFRTNKNGNYKYVNCVSGFIDSTKVDSLICKVALQFGESEISFCDICDGKIFGFGSGGGVIHRLIGSNDFRISGDFSIDTLEFLSPGQSITLESSMTVNNRLTFAYSNGHFTNLSGGGYSFIIHGDTVCTDNLLMQNVNSSGSSTALYSGDHGLDLGGNTGWSFSSCAPVLTNVLPGDINYDLITNNVDVLYLAKAMGETGHVRANASINYTPQPSLGWPFKFGNGVNLKHADCDGNAVVELADTLAITQN